MSWFWLWMESGSLLWKSMSGNKPSLHTDRPHAGLTSRIQHFLTRCGHHQRRHLLRLYWSHWPSTLCGHLTTWQRDTICSWWCRICIWSNYKTRSLEIPTRIIVTYASAKQTACHWSVPRVLVKTKWWPDSPPNAAGTQFIMIYQVVSGSCSQTRHKNLILRHIGLDLQCDFGDRKKRCSANWDAGRGRAQPG